MISVILEWQAKSIDGEWFGLVDHITSYTLLRETIGRLRECEDSGMVRNITLDGGMV
jgi:hypothetical protein